MNPNISSFLLPFLKLLLEWPIQSGIECVAHKEAPEASRKLRPKAPPIVLFLKAPNERRWDSFELVFRESPVTVAVISAREIYEMSELTPKQSCLLLI